MRGSIVLPGTIQSMGDLLDNAMTPASLKEANDRRIRQKQSENLNQKSNSLRWSSPIRCNGAIGEPNSGEMLRTFKMTAMAPSIIGAVIFGFDASA